MSVRVCTAPGLQETRHCGLSLPFNTACHRCDSPSLPTLWMWFGNAGWLFSPPSCRGDLFPQRPRVQSWPLRPCFRERGQGLCSPGFMPHCLWAPWWSSIRGSPPGEDRCSSVWQLGPGAPSLLQSLKGWRWSWFLLARFPRHRPPILNFYL